MPSCNVGHANKILIEDQVKSIMPKRSGIGLSGSTLAIRVGREHLWPGIRGVQRKLPWAAGRAWRTEQSKKDGFLCFTMS
jgi:hypothetical protein